MTEAYQRAKMIQEKNAFALYNHMELESADDSCVVMRLEIHETSKNPLGIVHGGAMIDDDAAGQRHGQNLQNVTGSQMHQQLDELQTDDDIQHRQ